MFNKFSNCFWHFIDLLSCFHIVRVFPDCTKKDFFLWYSRVFYPFILKCEGKKLACLKILFSYYLRLVLCWVLIYNYFITRNNLALLNIVYTLKREVFAARRHYFIEHLIYNSFVWLLSESLVYLNINKCYPLNPTAYLCWNEVSFV